MSRLLDCIYAVAGLFLLPLWLWKLPTAPRYRAGLGERLGWAPVLRPNRRRLWIHCASVGEASIPRRLVARLRERYPRWEIVFSTNTDTGAGRLRELYPDSTVFYMPLDFSFTVGRALDRVRPDLVLLVELEIWPNFLRACRRQGIPAAIVSGRIGPGSRRFLRMLQRFFPAVWKAVALCCARSEEDAAGFQEAALPAEKVFTCGSLKYDALTTEVDAARRRELARLFNIPPGAPVLVAGSTHPGEEAILAAAYRDLKLAHRELRLIVAPRHVERAPKVAAALRGRGLPLARKTDLDAGGGPAADGDVILLDTIGELTDCYGLATCAFVGRSLLPPGGGQNMMEPAALGKPVLVGPYTGNFRPEVNLLKRHDALIVVRDRTELVEQVAGLLSHPEKARCIGSAARELVLQSRGATARTLERLSGLLAEAE